MGDVCNTFQNLASLALGVNPATLFKCEQPPSAIPQLNLAPGSDLPVDMKTAGGGGKLSWPVVSAEACVAVAKDLAKAWDVKAGAEQSRNFTCVDRETDKVLVDFSVIRSCETGKDPAVKGSCSIAAVSRTGKALD